MIQICKVDEQIINEEADKLAKQAAVAEYIGPEPASGFTTIAVRSKVRQWAHKEHCRVCFNLALISNLLQ